MKEVVISILLLLIVNTCLLIYINTKSKCKKSNKSKESYYPGFTYGPQSKAATSSTAWFFGCDFGSGATDAIEACSLYGRGYNAQCSPIYDNGDVRHDSNCNVFCTCSP